MSTFVILSRYLCHEMMDQTKVKVIYKICLSRRRVREAERYSWTATRGVNEATLMENFPEDLQVDIRRHLFKFVKKVSTKISVA